MQGTLKKKGGLLDREWQERYFSPSVSDPQEIQYFLSEEHVNPQGSFSLAGATVNSVDVKGKNIIEVQISTGRKYQLLADTNEEHTLWMEGLQKIIAGEAKSEDIERNVGDGNDRNREALIEQTKNMKKELVFERFSVTPPAGEEGSPAPPAGKNLNKRVVIDVELGDLSSVAVDPGKFSDPTFKKALKLRPSVKIMNPGCLDSLAKRFQELDSSCSESRCVNNFQLLCPTIDNVLYDKTLCDKNGFVRKLTEVLSGTIPIPVNIELDEEKLFAKIQNSTGESDSAPAPVKKEVEETPPEFSDNEIPMEPAPISGISLEKKEEAEDSMEDIPTSTISLDKPAESKPSGISLDKKEDSEDEIPVSTISLDEPQASGISLDKTEEQSKPSGISLDKKEDSEDEVPVTTISLDKD